MYVLAIAAQTTTRDGGDAPNLHQLPPERRGGRGRASGVLPAGDGTSNMAATLEAAPVIGEAITRMVPIEIIDSTSQPV